ATITRFASPTLPRPLQFSEYRSRGAERVLGEALDYYLIGVVYRVDPVEQFDIGRTDHAVFDHCTEIDNVVPIFGAKQHDWDAFAHLPRLYQGEDFEQFVERAETAREEHNRLGKIDEPELPHEKIMEAEVQLPADIRVVELLVRNRDGEPDIETPCFRGAAVSRLHDAGTTAGADDEAPLLAAQLFRPFGQSPGQFSRCLIVESRRAVCAASIPCPAAFASASVAVAASSDERRAEPINTIVSCT